MPLLYRIYKNNNTTSKGYNKYYARANRVSLRIGIISEGEKALLRLRSKDVTLYFK